MKGTAGRSDRLPAWTPRHPIPRTAPAPRDPPAADQETRDIAEVPAIEVITTAAVHLMSAAAVKCGLAEGPDAARAPRPGRGAPADQRPRRPGHGRRPRHRQPARRPAAGRAEVAAAGLPRGVGHPRPARAGPGREAHRLGRLTARRRSTAGYSSARRRPAWRLPRRRAPGAGVRRRERVSRRTDDGDEQAEQRDADEAAAPAPLSIARPATGAPSADPAVMHDPCQPIASPRAASGTTWLTWSTVAVIVGAHSRPAANARAASGHTARCEGDRDGGQAQAARAARTPGSAGATRRRPGRRGSSPDPRWPAPAR